LSLNGKEITAKELYNYGAFIIELRIRPRHPYIDIKMLHQGIGKQMSSKLFNHKESKDVTFQVKGRVFHTHKLILSIRAPDNVNSFCDTDKTIPIEDVEPALFEQIIKHAYGEVIHLSTWKSHCKEILTASGKYLFDALQAEAESRYIVQIKLTLDNAIDELPYTDGNKSC
jgi:hypothetical protein